MSSRFVFPLSCVTIAVLGALAACRAQESAEMAGSIAGANETPASSSVHFSISDAALFGKQDQKPQEAATTNSTLPQPAPPPNYPTFKVTGVFQLDAAYFGQSTLSRQVLGDINDGLGFRRVRFGASGDISERASYLIEFDFAQAQARFVDLYGQIEDTPLGNVRIGRFRQPFGLTEQTSARELPFLERPTLFALSPFRQSGIMLFAGEPDGNQTRAISLFRATSDNFGNVYGEDGGYGTALRWTWLPIEWSDNEVVHFGLSYAFMDPARNLLQFVSQDEVFVGQQPNLGLDGLSVLPIVSAPPFVSSGLLDVDWANYFNLEAALSFGRTVCESEFRLVHVASEHGTADLPGAYVQVRHMLTGEQLPYKRESGVFGRVVPDQPLTHCPRGWGAWEIAGRLSYIDLNPLTDLPGTTGPARRLTSATLGLNWYWWRNAKTQFNWILGDLNDRAAGDSTTHTLAGRVQFDF